MKTILLLVFLGLALAAPTDGDKIVGDDECSKYVAPWIVSFKVAYRVCTGSLINPRWVLSVSHCYVSRAKLRLHEQGITASEGSEHLIESEMVIKHPKYNYYTRVNDIMLIKLPAAINRNVVPVPLPTKCAHTGDICLISGWSRAKDPAVRAYQLQCMDSPIFSAAVCRAANWRLYTDNNICLGYLEGGRHRKEPNSGGPVVCSGVLQGVVSWGYGWKIRGDPSLYTRVCNYVSWIHDTMAAN